MAPSRNRQAPVSHYSCLGALEPARLLNAAVEALNTSQAFDGSGEDTQHGGERRLKNVTLNADQGRVQESFTDMDVSQTWAPIISRRSKIVDVAGLTNTPLQPY